ncbi:cytoplasmic protein [Guyanagaster necrorhizus]|uniref:Cytoplasmic protein n=1 Tax=Guyanagaster necrorhizus TaxID=856835 RepID=A0A9P8B0D3_9AGAR|nr:cytoplasmic protein [Guyanagaster necrorhizus MCA 3950]KAG7452962.1 cytoplasmic protein [Guyanagaster necrorhizus MCA 3950]
MYSDFSNVLTNIAHPKTAATITLRIIKSFKYRTEKSLVLHKVNLETTTVGQLKELAHEAVKTQPGWKPYRNVVLDVLKLYTQAHSAKTTNLIINLDHDEWLFDDDSKILADVGFENETEVSFFNRELYEQFKRNPQTSWDC